MNKGLRDYIPLIGISILFVILKLQSLPLPFFWDAAWVYGPAIKEMAEGLPSLLPNAIDVQLSRGHPLLFHFLGGIWAKIFGTSFFSIHTYTLSISILMMAAVYMVIKPISGTLAASLGVLLFGIQEIFFIQTALILPEILLALLTFLSVHFYVRGKWSPYVLTASLAILTKESGVVVVVALFLFHLLRPHGLNLKSIALVLLPLAIGGIHFLGNFFVHGWLFFPEHMDMLKADLDMIQQTLSYIDQILFHSQGRQVLLLLFPLLAMAINEKIKVRWVIIIYALSLGFFVMSAVDFKFPYFLNWVVLVIIIVVGLLKLTRQESSAMTVQNKWLLISGYFVPLFIAFSSVNFFTPRYLLSTFPFIVIVCIFSLNFKELPRISTFIVVFIIGFQAFYFGKNRRVQDSSLGYMDGIKVTRLFVSYLERNYQYSTKIHCSFLDFSNLTMSSSGFLSSDRAFTNVGMPFDSETEIVIHGNLSPGVNIHELKSESLEVDTTFRHRSAWTTIYRVKR